MQPQPEIPPHVMALLRQIKSGASWFNWIAGLGVINAILILAHSEYGLAGGPAFASLAVVLGLKYQGGFLVAGLVIAALIAGVYLLLGFFANRAKLWAFIVGIVLFSFDTMLLFADIKEAYMSLAIHAWALYSLITGTSALIALSKLQREAQFAPPATFEAPPVAPEPGFAAAEVSE